MAENKILKSDISEEDVFKYITESAKKSMVIIDGYNAKLNETANAIANISKSADTSTLKGINDILKAVKELTNLKNTAVKNDNTKNKIQAEVKAYEQLLVEIKKKEDAENKLAQTEAKNHAQREKQYNKEIKDAEKLAQAQEKQAQKEAINAQKQSSMYHKIDVELSNMVKRFRDLAIQKELHNNLTEDEGREYDKLLAKITVYDNALKKVDTSYGKSTRYVGEYTRANFGLSNSINQITREAPAAAVSMSTFFLAISNNIPMFTEEIRKLKEENIELAKSGEPTKSVLKQVIGAFFSWQTALSVGVTLLTLYGAKLIEWGASLFQNTTAIREQEQALKSQSEAKKRYNEEIKKGREYIANESSEMVGNLLMLKRTNEGSRERSELIKSINEEYGTTLKNIQDETLFQEQLNDAIAQFIEYKRIQYQIQRNDEKIKLNLQYQEKEKDQLIKLGIARRDLMIMEDYGFDKMMQNRAKAYNDLVKLGASEKSLEIFRTSPLAEENINNLVVYNKHLEDYGYWLSVLNGQTGNYGKKKGAATKAEKQFNTEIEYTNDYISEQIQLLKELQDLENQRLSDLQQQNIEDVYANMMKRVTETGQLEVDELERLINEKTAQDIKYLEAKTNAEIQQLEFVYDAEMKLRRANLDAKYRDLLDQKNLPQDKRLEIESNYQKALSELDKEEQKRYEDLQSKKVIIAEKAKREATQIEKQGNEEINQKNDELIQAQIEFYKHQNDIRKEELEKEKKIAEERKKIAKDVRDTLERYGEELIQREIDRSKRKQDLMQKESDRAKEREQQLRELANNGNATASQSLALAEAQSLKRQQAIDREAKKQQAWETAKIAYKAVFDFMEKGDSLPIATLKGATGTMSMQALFKSLFGFRKGTKRTVGEELGTKFSSGEDGYLARVDAREKIINPELAGMTGSATTDEIVDGFLNFQKLNSGLIVPITARQEQQKPDVLAKKLDELTNVVKSKPEFSMHPDIVMGIVKGITTEEKRGIVRNRTKFRS